MLPLGAAGARILVTADAVGGVWTYALDLARGLAARGLGTVLAALGPPPDAVQRAAAEAVPGLLLHRIEGPLDWMAERREEVAEVAAAVAALAAREDVALAQLNSPALAALARFPVPVVGACHSCLATWWRAVRGDAPLPAVFAWRTALLAEGYRAADALVAPSAAFAAATAEAYAMPRPPRVVHNGRRALAVPAAAPADLVVTAGRLWDEGKDVATLDRAAARLPVPVLAAGPLAGPNGARIEPRHLRTPGRLGEAALAAILAQRPIFASAARYEPFGLAVLEAAQAGCALVLSDIPSFRELWGDAALFVPPGDDVTLASIINALLRDRERRAACGAAAQARARRYSVEAMVGGMLDIYRGLVRQGAAA